MALAELFGQFAEKSEHWPEDLLVIDFLVRLPVRLGVVGFNPFEKADGVARPASEPERPHLAPLIGGRRGSTRRVQIRPHLRNESGLRLQ